MTALSEAEVRELQALAQRVEALETQAAQHASDELMAWPLAAAAGPFRPMHCVSPRSTKAAASQ